MQDDVLRHRLGQGGPASVEKYALERVTDAWEALLGEVATGRAIG
jgi:hypothetical protein